MPLIPNTEENLLFDNFYDKPLRMHIELNGIVTPIDLPNPQLKSSPAIQGFVSGTGSQRVPTENLISECLTILFDSILQVRSEKEKTENLLLIPNKAFYKSSITH